jgi:hypothetical protein
MEVIGLTVRGHVPEEGVLGTHCRRLGGPREPAWDLGKELKLPLVGIRIPNRPARSLVTTDYTTPASLKQVDSRIRRLKNTVYVRLLQTAEVHL